MVRLKDKSCSVLLLFLLILILLGLFNSACAPTLRGGVPPSGASADREINLDEMRDFIAEAERAGRLDEFTASLETRRGASSHERGFARAVIAARQKDWNKARGELERLLWSHSNSAMVHLELGEVLLRQKNYAEAEEHLKQAQNLAPTDSIRGEALLLLITAAWEQRHPDEAKAYFKDLLLGSADPEAVDAALKKVYSVEGRRQSGFLVDYLKRNEPDPFERARILLRLGYLTQAVSELKAADSAKEPASLESRRELARAILSAVRERAADRGANEQVLIERSLPAKIVSPDAKRCMEEKLLLSARKNSAERNALSLGRDLLADDNSFESRVLKEWFKEAASSSSDERAFLALSLELNQKGRRILSSSKGEEEILLLGRYFLGRALKQRARGASMLVGGEADRALRILEPLSSPEAAHLKGLAHYLIAHSLLPNAQARSRGLLLDGLEKSMRQYERAVDRRPYRMSYRQALRHVMMEKRSYELED